jgi:hypothetical protein
MDLDTMAPQQEQPPMKTIQDAIIYSIKSAQMTVDAMTADLKRAEWEHRAVPGSNCPAWLIGHLILVDRRALEWAGVTDLPELPAGFEARFARQTDAAMAASFGDSSILIPLFDQHREMLIKAVANLPTSKFQEPAPRPSPRFSTFGEFFLFMGLHAALHAGQISTIRRSLGRPPLF